ncbi:MAG: efflux RND transporter periplasmic adaptor subunit [Flavisolibacter sp.]
MKFAILLLPVFAFVSCGQKSPVTHPTIQDITESVYAAGIIKSRNQYAVYPSAAGIIKSVLVKEGDLVQQGQALVVLQHEAARLSVENARVAADYASIYSNQDKLQEALVSIELASVKARNDSVLWLRQNNLWSMGIGSRYELEQRELAYKNSSSAVQTARLRYEQLNKQLRLSAQQSQKTLQINSSVTSDYTIRAASAGRVYQLSKKPGEFVSAQTPIAMIGDVKDFLLELQVDEHDIGSLALNQKVWVSLDSYEGQSFEAVIERILPLMDERSRSLKVEAHFTRGPAILYPNLTAEANILVAAKKNALLIPRTYLMEGDQVLMPDGSKRKVRTGLRDYQWVEILEGLQSDDTIQQPSP